MIADSSFVIAVANPRDKWHQSCLRVYLQQRGTMHVPQSALAEIAHMITKADDSRRMIKFLRDLPKGKYRLVALLDEDVQRAAGILETYADTRIDFVDATIIALAERLNITRILTVDRRDFEIVRPRHAPTFELLP